MDEKGCACYHRIKLDHIPEEHTPEERHRVHRRNVKKNIEK